MLRRMTDRQATTGLWCPEVLSGVGQKLGEGEPGGRVYTGPRQTPPGFLFGLLPSSLPPPGPTHPGGQNDLDNPYLFISLPH